MDPYLYEHLAAERRAEAVRWAELMRLANEGRRRPQWARVRHRLAHALIAVALWIDDAPRREPRLAGT